MAHPDATYDPIFVLLLTPVYSLLALWNVLAICSQEQETIKKEEKRGTTVLCTLCYILNYYAKFTKG